jgi:hypothetical protein
MLSVMVIWSMFLMAPTGADGNRSGEAGWPGMGEQTCEGEVNHAILTRTVMSRPINYCLANHAGGHRPGRKRPERDRQCTRSHGFRSGELVTAGTAAGDSMNFEPGNSSELNGGKRFTSTDELKCREMILALLGES